MTAIPFPSKNSPILPLGKSVPLCICLENVCFHWLGSVSQSIEWKYPHTHIVPQLRQTSHYQERLTFSPGQP